MAHPTIIQAPESQAMLAQGIGQLAKLLSITLGPNFRHVAVNGSTATQLLDDASVLSKQLLSLGDPFRNMGHQALRAALSQLSERVGDGSAICAVLTAALLKETAPLVAAGHHPNAISAGIRAGHASAKARMQRQAWSIETPEEIARVVTSANFSPELAAIVADMLDSLGADGSIVVEETRRIGLAHEYVDGGRWTTGIASPVLMEPEERQLVAHRPFVLVTSCKLSNQDQVLSLLKALEIRKPTNLLIVAPEFGDEVIALLATNRQTEHLSTVIAVKAPTSVLSGDAVLDDIAYITGGRHVTAHDEGALRRLTLADLGRAERAWATRSAFGIIGGEGDRAALQRRTQELRMQAREERDPVKRSHLSARAGNLRGLTGLIRVGTDTMRAPEIERAIGIARQALRFGVVAGGGAALARAAAEETGDGVGEAAFARALTEPIRTIMLNAGMETCDLSSVESMAFDATSRTWVDSAETGPIDALAVVEAVLDVAVSTALMVLSTDVLVRASERA